jgi:hypothetical protein
MNRIYIGVIILLLLNSSCVRNKLVYENLNRIEFTPDNDTVAFDRCYSNNVIKEKIQFDKNKRKENNFYDPEGKLISNPSVFIDTVSTAEQKVVVVLMPINKYKSYDIFFGGINEKDSGVKDSIVNNLYSIDIPLKPDYVRNDTLFAYIRSHTNNGNFAVYPFWVRLKK